MLVFAYGIVVPVFPFALTSRANISPDRIQTWVSIFLAIYGAALIISAPICGWVSDRLEGRQLPFIVGLLLLGGSTAMLCVGDSIALFVLGRILQGASAAVVWVVGLALLVDTVGPEEVGSAMGYVGLSMSLAILLAPLLGGVVLASAGYYSVFAMAFGLIVLDIILRFAMIEQKVAKKWLAREAQNSAVEKQGQVGNGNAKASEYPANMHVDALVRSPTLSMDPEPEKEQKLTRRVSVETVLPPNTPTPLKKFLSRLPPVVFLFGSRRVLCALWACVMQSSLLTSFDSILPLFVKRTFGWDSVGAGLIFLPIVISTFVGPLIGSLSDKYGPRWFATAGFIIACPFLILLRLVDHDSIGQKVLLCALLVLVGLGLTLALTPVMAEIVSIKHSREFKGHLLTRECVRPMPSKQKHRGHLQASLARTGHMLKPTGCSIWRGLPVP